MLKALVSFSGAVSMRAGETREIDDADIVADLKRAGYVEEIDVKPASRGRKSTKTAE